MSDNVGNVDVSYFVNFELKGRVSLMFVSFAKVQVGYIEPEQK